MQKKKKNFSELKNELKMKGEMTEVDKKKKRQGIVISNIYIQLQIYICLSNNRML